uniref:Uncharacterized protein n=1 Tax=Pararge aegeria TaxID=116150 RepID=S4PY37_9NEOP
MRQRLVTYVCQVTTKTIVRFGLSLAVSILLSADEQRLRSVRIKSIHHTVHKLKRDWEEYCYKRYLFKIWIHRLTSYLP